MSSRAFMFLIGLLSMVRVHLIGMIGISEILICVCAPVFYLKDYALLRRSGFSTMMNLMLLCCAGCLVASLYNNTPFAIFLRGLAAPIVLFSSFVFCFHYLRTNLNNLKWLAIGVSLSTALSLLINGANAEDGAVVGVGDANYVRTILFSPLITIPVILFYRKMPAGVSALILTFGGMFKILTSSSGRSSSLVMFAAALLVYYGGRSIRQMGNVRRYFVRFLIVGCIGLFVAKTAYTYSAAHGLLGESAREKYMAQTGGKGGFLNILIGGRIEAVVCIYAALDRPILGFGPWAADTFGYAREVQQKYGLYDYDAEVKRLLYLQQTGGREDFSPIPFHSHIFGNWVWYGVFGLLMWAYVVYLIFKFYRKAPDAIPQWWPIFAIFLPRLLWDIFFSPFGLRVGTGMIVCAMLLAIGIGGGRIPLDRLAARERMKYLP